MNLSCFRKWLIALLFAAPVAATAQDDSTALDSDECLDHFFVNAIKPDAKTLLVLPKGKVMSTAAFKKANDDADFMRIGQVDLDKDGQQELLIYNYTGGAHCCDEVYFFRKAAPTRYQFVAKTFGGDLCADSDNTFNYFFDQHFGYFFTCFACGVEDTTDEGVQPVHSIRLRYQKGKLAIVPGTTELKNLILDNLAKLAEMPYQPIDPDLGQDDGTRKEFAMNLAVYYFSFGKNLPATKLLFTKYYNHPDKTVVWSEFSKTLQYVRADNNF